MAPVTMYFRQVGRPSKNALWSALYLGRATLAMDETHLVGKLGVHRMFGRRAIEGEGLRVARDVDLAPPDVLL